MSIDYSGRNICDEVNEFLNSNTHLKDEVNYSYFNQIDDVNQSNLNLIISDFQGILDNDLDVILNDTSFKRNIVLVGNINDYENAFIDSLSLSYDPNDLSLLKVLLYVNTSKALANGNIVVKLSKGTRQISSLVIGAGEVNRVEFDIPANEEGLFIVELDGDGVYFDNEFYFTLSKKRKPKIALIHSSLSLYLREVFANSELFDLVLLEKGEVDFESISNSDLVVLSELDAIPSGLSSQIEDKTLIIFPSINSNSQNLENLNGIIGVPANSNDRFEIEFDFSNPLFHGVFERYNSSNTLPSAVPLFTFSGEFESVIDLRNGTPFLIKKNYSNHFLFNTNLDEEYSNVASHSIFLPLLYQIALSSVGADDNPYFYPGDLVELEVDNDELPPTLVSNTVNLIPEFNSTPSGMIIKLPSDLTAGYYTIIHDGDSLKNIGVNVPKKESIMEGLTIDELENYFDGSDHVTVQALSANSFEFGSSDRLIGFFKFALILTLIFILSETLLHRYLK